MAQPYKPVQVKQFPRLAQRQTAEDRYWLRFKREVVVKEYSAVTDIDFSSASPHDFAVTSSARVNIYSGTNCQLKRSYAKFPSTAYGGSFRPDGKLLVAGGESGTIQVFDINSRTTLRQFEGHKRPVHVTKFTGDGVHIVSGGDDGTVRCWDLATEQEDCVLLGHEDHVRAAAIHPSEPSMFLTGSYDNTVKLWDRRTQQVALSVDHGAPVEAVLMFPSASSFITAGGNYIRVWDALGSNRMLAHFSNHQKTVTGLCFDSQAQRLLSASLDRQVKVYDVTTWKVVHSEKFSSPLLSVAMAKDDKTLAVGMVSGLLEVRKRKQSAEDKAAKPLLRPGYLFESRQPGMRTEPRPGTYRYVIRGQSTRPSDDDFVVGDRRRRRPKAYDKLLQQFKYGDALDAVLETYTKPVMVASVLQELILRDGLEIALSNREEATLLPLLKYLNKNITNPRYTSLCISVTELLIDIYPPGSGISPAVDELFMKLRDRVSAEVAFQKELQKLVGSMDMIMAASQTSS